MILSYVDLNIDLVYYFGQLEKECNKELCNANYEIKNCVTVYIDEMLRLGISTPDWNYKLKRLKEVRYKRNRLCHGDISFREPWATVDDVRFVVDFRNNILNQTDPLALYYKHTRQQTSVVNQQTHYQQTQYPQPVYQKPEYKNQTPQRKSMGCFTAVLIVVAVIACVISFLM